MVIEFELPARNYGNGIENSHTELDDEESIHPSLFAGITSDAVPEDILEHSFINMSLEDIDENKREITDTDRYLENSIQNLSLEGFSVLDITPTHPGSSIQADDEENNVEDTEPANDIPKRFGLAKFEPPPLLCRHPPPAVGRDDDINKLREILDDVLIKTGQVYKNVESCDRILCGADNKIGCNLLKLQKEEKYKHFLPEFPVLHLRKSKINILFSAYKTAGLVQLLFYMCNNDKKEWSALISIEHIDKATRYVRRLCLSMHLAFVLQFLKSLPAEHADSIIKDLEGGKMVEISENWDSRYQKFLTTGCRANATFALHHDMMNHCDEVVALYVAERLGGAQGYDLLLHAVKSSLLFSFLNGAASYAPFCANLLIEHYSCGTFHQNLKKHLFSTPIGTSTTNFACDSKREIDHQDAIKSFRSGSNIASIKRRMSLIDQMNEVHESRQDYRKSGQKCDPEVTRDPGEISWSITNTDINYILPTTELILRRGGLCINENNIPYNMYHDEPVALSPAVLDENSYPTGQFLLKRYLVKENQMQMTKDDIPEVRELFGPRQLLKKAETSKGTTLKRLAGAPVIPSKSNMEMKEHLRQRDLKNAYKKMDCLSSSMNLCQAIVNADCTKPKVDKAKGIPTAITNVLKSLNVEIKGMVSVGVTTVPSMISRHTHLATVEFAGVKFQTPAISGQQYLKYIENGVLKSTLRMFPNLARIIICEEKYRFTPDTFKAATRVQRAKGTPRLSIAHLKPLEGILTSTHFDKDAVIKTAEGKSLISTYLAANAKQLNLSADITLDIDSEFILEGCSCDIGTDAAALAVSNEEICCCNLFSVPLRCKFSPFSQEPKLEKLTTAKQRKGEAEMAMVDWLVESQNDLPHDANIFSIVTSGDIDAVLIHMFALATKLTRKKDGTFKNEVYVLLQKKDKKFDIYNVTNILTALENHFQDRLIGMKIATVLAMGGNDFIPKYCGMSHNKVLQLFLSNEHFLENLFIQSKESNNTITLNKDVYCELVKWLHCSKESDRQNTFDNVRKGTMTCQRVAGGHAALSNVRNAQLWLPPLTAVERMADLVDLQIDYFSTAGNPMALLPDFLSKGCLRKTESGQTVYDFGQNSKEDASTLLAAVQKRKQAITPQKGLRKKRERLVTSTPRKQYETTD